MSAKGDKGKMALRKSKPKPRAVDLFSGCGGLTLGLKKAGFAVVGAVEKDRLAVDTYCANHPEVYVWNRDIRYQTAPQQLRT
jgi:DNA (cytosine-5)-methyltransferase 1